MLLATERYCHAEFYDRLTMRQYCEAFEILYPQIKKTTLQVVARSLASCSFAPRAVIMALAVEPIAIARPILLQSQILGQVDMLRIIDVAGERHALMIAERHDIGPSVVTRLRELKVDAINEALTENAALIENPQVADGVGAAVPAMPADLDATGSSAGEAEGSKRHDESEDKADPAASETVQKAASEVLAAAEFEQQLLGELESIPPAEAATDLLRAAARGSRLSEELEDKFPAMADAEAAKPIVDLAGSLEKIAAAKSRQGMATLMAKASGFSLDTAFQVLEDTSGDTLAVFLKSQDVDAAAASRILMLTFPSIGLSTQNAMRAIRFYRTLEIESCREAVDQWPKDEPKKAAHQPYLEDADGIRWAGRETTYERRDVELEEARRQALG